LVDSIIIKGCTVIHNEVNSVETDLITVSYAKNIFIRNNYLYHSNNNDRHCDAIQFQNPNENVEISGNYIEHIRPSNPVTGWADNFIFLNYVKGAVKIFNNLFKYDTHIGWFNVIAHGVLDTADYGQTYIYNNTFIGKSSYSNTIVLMPYGLNADSLYIKNNIFYDERVQGSSSDYPLFTVPNSVPASNLNNNLFYNPNGYPYLYSYKGYNRTLAQLQSSGAELNSIQGQNPQFVNFGGGNYHLLSTSPARNAGVSLSSFFTIDKDGVSRPQESVWDIGAYEYAP